MIESHLIILEEKAHQLLTLLEVKKRTAVMVYGSFGDWLATQTLIDPNPDRNTSWSITDDLMRTMKGIKTYFNLEKSENRISFSGKRVDHTVPMNDPSRKVSLTETELYQALDQLLMAFAIRKRQ